MPVRKLKTIVNTLRAFNYHTAARLEKPQTHFRLLELYPASASLPSVPSGSGPANGDATEPPPLLCRVFTTPLTHPSITPFKALSYVWASDATPHYISVVSTLPDGQTATLSLPITSSLYAALHHLRDPDEPITIWIDQLCIDQSNPAEKAAQVSLMGQIYSSASQVLVWLGPAESNSDAVMQLWGVVGKEVRDIGIEKYYTKEGWPRLYDILSNADPDDAETQRYQAVMQRYAGEFAAGTRDGSIKAWFRRSWFTRAWVTQEFCMCPDTVFVCGRQRLDVDLVMLAGQVFTFSSLLCIKPPYSLTAEEMSDLGEDPTATFFSCRQRRRRYETKTGDAKGDTLFALLKKMFVGRETDAKVWRDRVYSLLGLAVDAEALGIRPDYEDLWSEEKTAEIMTDVARRMITNDFSGRVDVLCYSRFPKGISGLPSWVPDWQAGTVKSYYQVQEAVDEHYFAACGEANLAIQVLPSWSTQVLGLKGFWVDTVDMLAPGGDKEVWPDTDRFKGQGPRLIGYLRQVEALLETAISRPNNPYSSEERRLEALWRVPIADTWDHQGGWLRASRELKVDVQFVQAAEGMMYDSWINTTATQMEPEQAQRLIDEFNWAERNRKGELGHKYRLCMAWHGGNKKPFLTTKGYLGMGPADMEVGDVVVVFCGGRIPFVVRQLPVKEDGRETFSFLGEAFCDGIMDGEAAKQRCARRSRQGSLDSPRISPTFPQSTLPELHQIWKFGTQLRRTTRQLLFFVWNNTMTNMMAAQSPSHHHRTTGKMKVDSWMMAAGFLASTTSALGPNVPETEKRLPGKPAPMPNWKWPNPFQSSRAEKYEATCQVQRSFKAEEFKLDDLAQNPPLGLLPWRDALKDVFAEREYPGGWDGIDNHGYDRNILKMDYETVPLKVREWIEEQERKQLPGSGLYALFARPAPGTRVFKQVPVPKEPTPEFREKDDRRVLIFAPGAIYENLPLWLGEDSGCDDEMLDLAKYAGQPKDGGVIGYPIYHSKPQRSKGERDIEFSLLAQVVKLKEGETDNAIESASQVEAEAKTEAEKPAATEVVKEAVKEATEAAKEATEAVKDEL
ncbi:heterokaryon incompatibility protein-domain-containing protein [Cercophora samala]|uniref:Heterokaryon incompatibility protein-domain-containing protein n=1 Tax=Cercophora samala TaxID=330535 RepID=A0AA39Z1K3_9PEZI|nr:heterokaryon incompatibility protein-domain-containing protein [Cercophora samala]